MVKDHFKGASYNSCFAVFDGHGGQRAAEFARQRLSTMLELHSELETNVMGSITQGKSSLTVKVKQPTLLPGRPSLPTIHHFGSSCAVPDGNKEIKSFRNQQAARTTGLNPRQRYYTKSLIALALDFDLN